MKRVRLFIDPASKSTGWALFKGNQLLKSGTVIVKGNIHERLVALHWRYAHLFQGRTLIDLKECHIEQFGGRPHRYLVFSVGVLISAIDYAEETTQDVPVSSWQKYTDWKGNRLTLLDYLDKVESEDELAAIGMGLWYTEEKLGYGKGKEVRFRKARPKLAK